MSDARQPRRTKIVATLGPATRDPDTLTRLIAAGADALRLNFSHGDRAEKAEMVASAREAAARAGREVALIGDLPGPKLRLGEIEGDVVELAAGQQVVLTTEEIEGSAERIPVSWDGLPEAVSPGELVYLADGRIRLRVSEVAGSEVSAAIELGGAVASHQGLNLPGAAIPLPAVGEADVGWIDFAVEQGIDLLAVSFVRSSDDLTPVLERLAGHGADIPVIAKIEKPQAAEDAEAIIEAATGGIMVARGDLGIEIPIETMPLVQKRLLALAGRFSKPSITATQMLASMVRSSRPTRAEATDVANAIFDGTDAVMLSEETAVGAYPVEAVEMMDHIARATEGELPYGDWLTERVDATLAGGGVDIAETVARSAVASAYFLDLPALVVPTRSGRTARLVSAHRPRMPVLALSPRLETVRRLNLLFGVRCELDREYDSIDELLAQSATQAREFGMAESGELIGITAGLPTQELGTNLFEVHRVP